MVSVTEGFPPLLGPGARVLVLGSLPSQKSLQKNQYYGHPQNVFWRVMAELFGASVDLAYADRVAILIQNGIAVWDVLASSVRPGSMDSDIDQKTATANDFATLLRENTGIRLVCFNGQAAAKLFDRLVDEQTRQSFSAVDFVTMPSTSPAYAAMSFAEKLERWSYVAAVLDPVAGVIR